jgi:hypothetical protein
MPRGARPARLLDPPGSPITARVDAIDAGFFFARRANPVYRARPATRLLPIRRHA